MQTASALNNIIRILFNPKIEAFRLFDFLLVKSCENRYLAQITEIYEDKFDSSQNVAKLKIFYKISENNEVMPYDNFTPSKECEIVKIKESEIENFINLDKETFVFAKNAKSNTELNIQYDFFNNSPVVLADKIEYSNTISLNIAEKLSQKRHSIIIDSTGVIEHDCAKKITANKDIKIPLNFSTIDYVFDRCLNNGSLEFQITVGSIINEIKNFAKKQPLEFIPFNGFLRVILEQYKATPYPDLKVLIMKMKKFQMNEIFASYKKDVENLHKTIEKNPVTVVDISGLDSAWQKAYLEYLTDAINNEVYLITRINDENCDIDLINKIYNKKKNIALIPTVSYNYKKLPTLMQYCKNYILMPSLYQRNDFLDANFALANLISDNCILFGENTDNFLYLAKDFELTSQEKKKNYRKIVLSMVNDDESESAEEYAADNNSKEQGNDSEKLLRELSELEEENSKKIAQKSSLQEEFTEIENPTPKDAIDEFDEIISENPRKDTMKIVEDNVEKTGGNTVFEDVTADEINEEDGTQNTSLGGIAESIDNDIKNNTNDSLVIQDDTQDNNDDFKDILNETESEESKSSDDEPVFADDELVFLDEESDSPKTTSEEKSGINQDDNINFDIISSDEIENATETNELPEENNPQEEPGAEGSTDDVKLTELSENPTDSEVDFSDEELDFFQLAQESQETSASSADDIDLSNIAASSLDSSFEDIINTKTETKEQSINTDNDTKINEELLNSGSQKENLPIFKEEIKQDISEYTYSVGDKVSHKNYGTGVIIKILKYEGRQLLQIDFEEAGKKTLEPRVANVKLIK